MPDDQLTMQLAIKEAQKAARKGEIPVGAIIMRHGKILARAYNLKESKQNPLAHAEILAIQKTVKQLAAWRLQDCVIYVTLEPCPMCFSALVQARISKIVFGANDPVMGACGSKTDLRAAHGANPIPLIVGGVMAKECEQLMRDFWRDRRKKPSVQS